MEHTNFLLLLIEAHRRWRAKTLPSNVHLFRDILHYLGYWPCQLAKPSPANWFLARYIFVCGVIVTSVVLPNNLAVLNNTDIFGVCETVVTLFVAGMVLVHSGTFLLQSPRFDQVMDAYHDMERCSQALQSHPVSVVVQGRRRDDFILCYYSFFTVAVFPGIALGLPIYCALTRDFFIRVWYPWDFTASPQFELTIAAWIVPFVVGSHLVVLVYVFLMSLLVEIVRHFQLLRHNLEHVVELAEDAVTLGGSQSERRKTSWGPVEASWGPRKGQQDTKSRPAGCKRKDGTKAKVIVVQEFLKGSRSSWKQGEEGSVTKRSLRRQALKQQRLFKMVDTALEHCVTHQVSINRLLSRMEKAFYWILIHQFNSSVCPMIAAIVLITNTVGFDPRAALLVMTILGCLCPTAIFCWLADKVAEESEAVKDAVFGCDWLRVSDGARRTMRIIMSRSNHPLEMRVAGFIPLSLETFSKLIRLTFNSYMSLRTALERSHQGP